MHVDQKIKIIDARYDVVNDKLGLINETTIAKQYVTKAVILALAFTGIIVIITS